MRYHVLACDYDNTLADEGRVAEATLAALERLLATGRKLLLVTGRDVESLLRDCPAVTMFHGVVAENGALLYDPATRQEKLLATAPPAEFSTALRKHGVERFSVGRVIVGTERPFENAVLAATRDCGLELQTIFNRDSVMVLPAGVNKATGLRAALDVFGLSPHEVAGVGDAENDHAFLDLCEFSVAVSNAVPALRDRADWVTQGTAGAGVVELIDALVAADLEPQEKNVARHRLHFGVRPEGGEVWLSPRGPNLLIGGPSGSGKSTAATSFLERLIEAQYQFCIIDPEGDYEGLPGTVTLGRGGRGPMAEEVIEVLTKPQHNAVVNLLGLPVTDRRPFFLDFVPRMQEMRARSGRPHWLIVDEAHHLLPASWEPNHAAAVGQLQRTAFITVHPDQIVPAALQSVGTVLAVGKDPQQTLALFCQPLRKKPPHVRESERDTAVLWPLGESAAPYAVRITPSKIEHQRHVRKYAIGELPPDRSFFFRGPEEKLNLRAQNLQMFLQLAEGVDEETWLHHLRQGDYSGWFRFRIKDDELADEAQRIEHDAALSAADSRAGIRELIERRYIPDLPPPLPIPGTDAGPQHSP